MDDWPKIIEGHIGPRGGRMYLEPGHPGMVGAQYVRSDQGDAEFAYECAMLTAAVDALRAENAALAAQVAELRGIVDDVAGSGLRPEHEARLAALATPAAADPEIDVHALVARTEALLDEAKATKGQNFGAVNWGDLGVRDVEVRRSLLYPENSPLIFILIEEAAPDCELRTWLCERLGMERVCVETEW